MRFRVVVVGAGFGGLQVARSLARHGSAGRLDMTLIDRSPYHLLRPKLPQAIGARIACAVHVPLVALLRNLPVRLLVEDVTAIDPVRRRVTWHGGALDADILVLALGGDPSVPPQFAGRPSAVLPVWSFDQACGIRRRIEFLADATRRGRCANTDVVVIGAGFVGVEVASEVQARLARIYGVRPHPTVTLLEARDRVLPRLDLWASDTAEQRLTASGVEVLRRTQAVGVTDGQVWLADGQRLGAGTIVWAGGRIQAPAVAPESGLADETGRIPVTSRLETVRYANVFALGDCAYMQERGAEACEPSAHRAGAEAVTAVRKQP